ncbi:hypothetical protein [Alteromonas sp. H39]|uniref:hypothetical protein n=1 Tax=Alteromonas sp. H39 TaxID=3389876 RepID=UPI0039E045DC
MMFSRPKRQKQALIDQRILAIHRAIAGKVLCEPHYIERARAVLSERYKNGMMRYGSFLLWESILNHASEPDVFVALLLAEDPRTASLRRATIFTGVLTEAEREAVLSMC